MNTLLIGVAERQRIAALRAKAEAAPLPAETVKRQLARRRRGETVPVPPEFTIELPEGFRVTYTIEHWLGSDNNVRCLAVSVAAGELCDVGQVNLLLEEFGFTGRFRQLPAWIETSGGRRTINLIEEPEARQRELQEGAQLLARRRPVIPADPVAFEKIARLRHRRLLVERRPVARISTSNFKHLVGEPFRPQTLPRNSAERIFLAGDRDRRDRDDFPLLAAVFGLLEEAAGEVVIVPARADVEDPRARLQAWPEVRLVPVESVFSDRRTIGLRATLHWIVNAAEICTAAGDRGVDTHSVVFAASCRFPPARRTTVGAEAETEDVVERRRADDVAHPPAEALGELLGMAGGDDRVGRVVAHVPWRKQHRTIGRLGADERPPLSARPQTSWYPTRRSV